MSLSLIVKFKSLGQQHDDRLGYFIVVSIYYLRLIFTRVIHDLINILRFLFANVSTQGELLIVTAKGEDEAAMFDYLGQVKVTLDLGISVILVVEGVNAQTLC